MHPNRLLFVVAFLATSMVATPVGDDPNLLSGAALFSKPSYLDLSKDSTNKPPPETASSKSASQFVDTDYDTKDMPFQDYSKQSIDLAQKSAGDFSTIPAVNLFSANSLSVSASDQNPDNANSPDKADISLQSLSTTDVAAAKGSPDCNGWWRLCCFGEIFFDDEDYMSVDKCYPCKYSFHLFICFSLFRLPTSLDGQLQWERVLTNANFRRRVQIGCCMRASGAYILLLTVSCRLHS